MNNKDVMSLGLKRETLDRCLIDVFFWKVMALAICISCHHTYIHQDSFFITFLCSLLLSFFHFILQPWLTPNGGNPASATDMSH